PTGVDVLPTVNWELTVSGATPAAAAFQDNKLFLQAAAPAAVAVYVPPGLPIAAEPAAGGLLLRTKTQADLSSEAGSQLFPGAAQLREINDGWKFNPDPEARGLDLGFANPA